MFDCFQCRRLLGEWLLGLRITLSSAGLGAAHWCRGAEEFTLNSFDFAVSNKRNAVLRAECTCLSDIARMTLTAGILFDIVKCI